MKKTVLITGAAGQVGQVLRRSLRKDYNLVLTDLRDPDDLESSEIFHPADLRNFEKIPPMLKDVDGIIHLAAISTEPEARADINRAFDVNVMGTANLYLAAALAGVKRIVFASTHHVQGMHPVTKTMYIDTPRAPDGVYAGTKIVGEDLSREFATAKLGHKIFIVRVGSYQPFPQEKRHMATWISPRDFERLVIIGLESPKAPGKTVFGVSDNSVGIWRNGAALTEDLGYYPQDSADNFPEARSEGEKYLRHGGAFAVTTLEARSRALALPAINPLIPLPQRR